MRLLQLNLENFRNISFAALEFGEGSHFLLGSNGQGKTNLLEAIGLISALRSFRTQDNRALIREGEKEARLFCKLEHEHEGVVSVQITLSSKTKRVELEGERIRRLADFIGLFPTAVFSSEDIQLLRGAPQLRRRLLDMILSTIDREYFTSLRRYHRSVQERNSILRHEVLDLDLIQSFERAMAEDAVKLIAKRTSGIAWINERVAELYAIISGVDEAPALTYKANTECAQPDDFLVQLAESRTRDHILKSTQRGPHRDDIGFRLKKKNARDYGSEGQQRGLVVALRLAQLRLFQEKTGVVPLVLADDVLGELDPVRKKGFWKAVGIEPQIIATGTVLPEISEQRHWSVFHVDAGGFAAQSAK